MTWETTTVLANTVPAPLGAGMVRSHKAFEVAIDARWLRSGLGTYTYQLLAGLSKLRSQMSVRAIVSKQNTQVVSPFCKSLRIVNAPIYTIREQIEMPGAVRGCDLLHVPHYNIPIAYRGPLIATIHDLTHLLNRAYSHSLRSWFYARPMLKFVASRADHILTVSNYSRKHIIERLNVDPSKVTTVHCGVGAQFRPLCRETARADISATLQVSGPYLLFVGNLKPHKNVGTLLQAFRDLMNRGMDHHLIVVGDDRLGRPAILQQIQDLALSERVKVFASVDPHSLVNLYVAADALVLPSFDEGFGLPVIEAMSCGTPVICSRAASLPEIGGDAAEYFDPRSRDELVAAIRRLLDSKDLRLQMRENGLSRAKQFTWEASAMQHYQAYARLSC